MYLVKRYTVIGVVLCVALFSALLIFMPTNNETPSATSTRSYTNEPYRFSVEVPSGWVANELTGNSLVNEKYGKALHMVGFRPEGQVVLYQHAVIVREAPLDQVIDDIIGAMEEVNYTLLRQRAPSGVNTLHFVNNADQSNITEFYFIDRQPLVYIFENHGEPGGSTPHGDVGYKMFQSMVVTDSSGSVWSDEQWRAVEIAQSELALSMPNLKASDGTQYAVYDVTGGGQVYTVRYSPTPMALDRDITITVDISTSAVISHNEHIE